MRGFTAKKKFFRIAGAFEKQTFVYLFWVVVGSNIYTQINNYYNSRI